MKSILIEDFISRNINAPQEQVQFKDDKGVQHQGWAIAKPLNYDKEYMSAEDRKAMAQEVLEGHAIAVHFTQDEIALGEVPTLYRRHMEQKAREETEQKMGGKNRVALECAKIDQCIQEDIDTRSKNTVKALDRRLLIANISNDEYIQDIRGRLFSPEQIEFVEKILGEMKYVHENTVGLTKEKNG